MYLHACTSIIMYELSMFTQCIIMYSLIRIFHIYEQIFLAIDQRGSDNRGCTVWPQIWHSTHCIFMPSTCAGSVLQNNAKSTTASLIILSSANTESAIQLAVASLSKSPTTAGADPEILLAGWWWHTISYSIAYKGASVGGWLATHFTPLDQPLHWQPMYLTSVFQSYIHHHPSVGRGDPHCTINWDPVHQAQHIRWQAQYQPAWAFGIATTSWSASVYGQIKLNYNSTMGIVDTKW